MSDAALVRVRVVLDHVALAILHCDGTIERDVGCTLHKGEYHRGMSYGRESGRGTGGVEVLLRLWLKMKARVASPPTQQCLALLTIPVARQDRVGHCQAILSLKT